MSETDTVIFAFAKDFVLSKLFTNSAVTIISAVHSETHSIVEMVVVEAENQQRSLLRCVVNRSDTTIEEIYINRGQSWEIYLRNVETSKDIVALCLSEGSLDSDVEEEAEEKINLEDAFGVLNRKQLELIIAKAISNDSSVYNIVLEHCREPLDSLSLRNEMSELFPNTAQMECERLKEFVEEKTQKFLCFAKIDKFKNAFSGLEALSSILVEWSAQNSPSQAANEKKVKKRKKTNEFFFTIREEIEGVYSVLENAWQEVLAMFYKKNGDEETMKSLFETLSGWRKTLVDIHGPIFSDPLRTLKKRLSKVSE